MRLPGGVLKLCGRLMGAESASLSRHICDSKELGLALGQRSEGAMQRPFWRGGMRLARIAPPHILEVNYYVTTIFEGF